MANSENQDAPPRKQDAEERLALQKRHLASLALMRKTIGACLAELEQALGDPALFDQLPELLDPSNFEAGSRTRQSKLRAIRQALIDLPTHAKALKALSEEITIVFALEHQALDIHPVNLDAAPVGSFAVAKQQADDIDKKYERLKKYAAESEQRRRREFSPTPAGSGDAPFQAAE